MIVSQLIFKFDGSLADLDNRKKNLGKDYSTFTESRTTRYEFYTPSAFTVEEYIPVVKAYSINTEEDHEENYLKIHAGKIYPKDREFYVAGYNGADLAHWINTTLKEADLIQYNANDNEHNGSVLAKQKQEILFKEHDIGGYHMAIFRELAEKAHMTKKRLETSGTSQRMFLYSLRTVSGEFQDNASEQFVFFTTGAKAENINDAAEKMGFRLEDNIAKEDYYNLVRKAAGLSV